MEKLGRWEYKLLEGFLIFSPHYLLPAFKCCSKRPKLEIYYYHFLFICGEIIFYCFCMYLYINVSINVNGKYAVALSRWFIICKDKREKLNFDEDVNWTIHKNSRHSDFFSKGKLQRHWYRDSGSSCIAELLSQIDTIFLTTKVWKNKHVVSSAIFRWESFCATLCFRESELN